MLFLWAFSACSRLTGSFTAEDDSILLFTIPYDSGWQVEVDGKSVSGKMVLDCLFAVPVGEGSHTFQIRFLPRGISTGCILSAGALFAAAFWILPERKKHRR